MFNGVDNNKVRCIQYPFGLIWLFHWNFFFIYPTPLLWFVLIKQSQNKTLLLICVELEMVEQAVVKALDRNRIYLCLSLYIKQFLKSFLNCISEIFCYIYRKETYALKPSVDQFNIHFRRNLSRQKNGRECSRGFLCVTMKVAT